MSCCKRGLSGIGLMIILIAIILISATSAILLMNMVVDLKTTAIRTGDETERSVINGVEIVSVMGTDGSVGKDIEHFEMVMRLKPGSDTIGLINNTLITMKTQHNFQSFIFNSSQGNTASQAGTTGDYTVEWIKTASDYETGYLKRGDLIRARFNYYPNSAGDTTGGLGEDEPFEITVIPQYGSPTVIHIRTPRHISDLKEGLYPREFKI